MLVLTGSYYFIFQSLVDVEQVRNHIKWSWQAASGHLLGRENRRHLELSFNQFKGLKNRHIKELWQMTTIAISLVSCSAHVQRKYVIN